MPDNNVHNLSRRKNQAGVFEATAEEVNALIEGVNRCRQKAGEAPLSAGAYVGTRARLDSFTAPALNVIA